MYGLGFCKNGSICNFRHTPRESEVEDSEKITALPIWYIEYVLEKPISMIFEDFEEQNKTEVEALFQKICDMKPYNKQMKNFYSGPMQIEMSQNSTTQSKYNYQSHQAGYIQNDIYSDKKDFIIRSLSKKVRYFMSRTNDTDYVKFAMEHNIIINVKQNSIKLKEALKSCDEVILIIFDEQSLNFNGFCKYKKELIDKDPEYTSIITDNPMMSGFKVNSNTSYVKIDWYWKTKLSYDKVELLKNPLNNEELLVDSKDCQEISMDIGNYVCRLMIKRLSKFEVKEYMEKRKLNDELLLKKNTEVDNSAINTTTSSNYNKIDLNNLILEEITKSNINKNLVFQTSGSSNTTNNPTSKSSNNNIIVTNISNLQVNISQNSYRASDHKKTTEGDRRKKKKDRSRSRSREAKYERYKKERRRRSRSRSLKKSNRSKFTKRKFSDENGYNYDSDETVVMKEESYRDKAKDYKNKSYQNSDFKNFHDDTTSIRKDTKAQKSNLFSNAMKKIALQYEKPK